MERENIEYSPLWITNETGYAYFHGNYIWESNNETFEIAGLEATALEIPTTKNETSYLMKKVDNKWQIAFKPGEGGSFIPIHTQLTDKIIEFIVNKHEWDGKIIYPHHSHPHK